MKAFSSKWSSKDKRTSNSIGLNAAPILNKKSLSIFPNGNPFIQPKLKIGQPNDKYEQEADRVADRVMRMPEPKQSLVNSGSSLENRVQRQSTCPECTEKEEEETVQSKSISDQITPLVQRQEEPEEEEEEEEQEPVQSKQTSNQTPHIAPGLQNQIQSMKGGGQPLAKAVRNYFEPRFGTGFSQVRVHTDSRAGETAKSINAKAFTRGKDVVFGSGHYSSGTVEGKRLLAHELAHVVQQGATTAPGSFRTNQLLSPVTILSAGTRLQRAPTCSNRDSLSAPKDNKTLKSRLQSYMVLRSKAPSTDFDNILFRHIDADTDIGKEYLKFVRNNAYPMADFCITYNGKDWNNTFNDVKSVYSITTPESRAMKLVNKEVREYDRKNLLMYDEKELHVVFSVPGKKDEILRDPFASPLTPKRLKKKKKGTVLHGSAVEASLLQEATDKFLQDELSRTVTGIKAKTPAAISSGNSVTSDIFAWGTAKAEDAKKDPNSFDAEIVQWVKHFNKVLDPRDKKEKPNPLDPDLFKALIWVESRFSDTAAAKTSTARGLTQMRGTERKTVGTISAGVQGITDINFLGSPSVQIAAGIRILFEKYRRSHDWPTAVSDYNGGKNKDKYKKEVLKAYKSHKRS